MAPSALSLCSGLPEYPPQMLTTAQEPRRVLHLLENPSAKVLSEPVTGLLRAAEPRASLLFSWLQAVSVPSPGPEKGKSAVSDAQLL